MPKYRNEWKFVYSDRELALLEHRLSQVLHLDSHSGENRSYNVKSLYFDDYANTSAYQNAAGLPDRSKWRIRYYGGGTSKHMHLEYKRKHNGLGIKKSCKITEAETNLIIAGEHEKVLWGTDEDLLKRFIGEIMTRQYKPRVIVDYERVAYVEPTLNIRVTLDKNISASYEFEKFTTGHYVRFPIQEQNLHVLEVKFDDILPGYLRNIINSHSKQQGSFSKYYLGRKKLEEIF